MDDAGLLVPVDGAELEEPQRQLAVGPLAALVDEDVERAVHGLDVVLLATVELHGREHAVGEPVQVPGGLEQFRLGDVRGIDELVAGLDVALPGVVLHQPPNGAPFGMEHGQARADLLGEREEVQLGTEAPMVAALRLLELVQVGGKGLFRFPRRPVDALQLRALLVASPVCAGHPHQPEMPEPAGRWHVWPPAQVSERG